MSRISAIIPAGSAGMSAISVKVTWSSSRGTVCIYYLQSLPSTSNTTRDDGTEGSCSLEGLLS
jgi:hypothetical protein